MLVSWWQEPELELEVPGSQLPLQSLPSGYELGGGQRAEGCVFKRLGKGQLFPNSHRCCVKNADRQPLLQQERKGAQGWCMWEAGGGAGLHFWSGAWKGALGELSEETRKG